MTKISSSFGKPTVLLAAELDDLSYFICKKLLEKSCKIFLITKKSKRWQAIFKTFGGHKNIETIKINDIPNLERLDYIIYQYNLFRILKNKWNIVKKEIQTELKTLSEKTANLRTKNIMLLPSIYGILIDKSPLKGRTIYFSETYGPYMVFSKNSFMFAAFDAIKHSNKIEYPKDVEKIYPLYSETASQKILEILFSVSYPYELTLVGSPISPKTFLKKIRFDIKMLSMKRKYYKGGATRILGKEISLGRAKGITETLEYLKTTKETSPKINKRKSLYKKLSWYSAATIIIPITSLLFAIVLLGASFFLVQKGSLSLAEKTLYTSRIFSSISDFSYKILSTIPVVGKIFGFPTKVAEIMNRSALVGTRGVLLVNEAKRLSYKFIGDSPYSVSYFSEELSTEIDYIYKESGFILSEIYSSPILISIFKKTKGFTELAEKREQLIPIAQFTRTLPELLGEGSKRRYLILLQNNMELRPTGGFIGSFALANIEGGRLTDIEIWDVYEADGQLEGHVEPPIPIKRYLNEANWFLRDSNWDSDFGISAARAEWFLDKEIDEKVDGVVGVDLEFIKSFLMVSGGVYVSDYDMEINQGNFYSITQKEVEEDFFPGSTKKSSFLTAVYKAIVEKIKEQNQINGLVFGKEILKNLQERHLQIFVHQKDARETLNKLSWGGEVSGFEACGQNCYSDLLGVVESNFGVNKANLYVQRSISAEIIINENKIQRKLTLTLDNSAQESLGDKGVYKVYIRVFGPQDAIFDKVKINQGGVIKEMEAETTYTRDHQEAGILVFVLPKESTSITFIWESPAKLNLQSKGEYKFTVRKQAGTFSDGLVLKVSRKMETLTPEEGFVYNTQLARDFVSRIYW